jgi:hypothetical protein
LLMLLRQILVVVVLLFLFVEVLLLLVLQYPQELSCRFPRRRLRDRLLQLS